MRAFFLKPFLLLLVFSSVAEEKNSDIFLDSASSEFVYEKETKNQKALLNLTAQQITGFIESTDSITNLSASLTYPIQDKLSFSITQVLNRNYYIKTDEIDNTGLWIQDTVLSLNKTAQWFTDSQFSFGLSSSLPISYYSRLNKVVTVTSLSMNASLKMLPLLKIKSSVIKELNLFIQPAFRYYLSAPVTPIKKINKKGEQVIQRLGGSPLPQILYGLQNIGVNLKVSDKLSFSSSVGRWNIMPYKVKSKNEFSLYDKKYHKPYYSLSLSAKYQIFKSLGLQLAYSHVDSLNKGGQIQNPVLFDDQVSSWLVSASYSFGKN